MKKLGRGALSVVSVLAVGALVAVALIGPAGAHKGAGHIWKAHIRPKLQNPGTINTATNPVDWTKLKNVPADFADGVDDGITSIDPTTTQSRVSGTCGAGSSIRVINQDGTVDCEVDDAGGGGVAEVGGAKAVTGTSAFAGATGAFTQIPGATLNITVPAGQTMLLTATFSAESVCHGGGVGGWCSVRIDIGGAEGAPAAGGDFAFDSTDDGDEAVNSWEGRSMQRVRTLGAGNYTVNVLAALVAPATTFRIDDWALVVSRDLVAP